MNKVTIEIDGVKHVLLHTQECVQCSQCSLYDVCNPEEHYNERLCSGFFNKGCGYFTISK